MKKVVLALCAMAVLGGCGEMDVPDLNSPGLDSLQKNPTPSLIKSASTGLLIGHRAGMATQNGYVSMLGILGRESYVMDPADPRYVGEMLAGEGLDPGSPAFGGNFWVNPYANIRNAHNVLDALEKVAGMTEAEKEATRGFAKTIQALDFLVIVNTRDTNPVPIDVNRPLTSELAPLENKGTVLAHIATLLDDGRAHLEAGGAAFPFPLSRGFIGFDKPESFLRFNRAVKARVEVYRGRHDEALIALSQSFLDPAGPLDLGVFHAFGTGSGDTVNGLNSVNIYAHPSLRTDAETQADSDELDARYVAKVRVLANPGTWQGLTSNLGFSMYIATNTIPVPIIRNEELLLLRAEAHIGRGNIPAAADDLNTIRTRSGGLAPRSDLTADNIVDELLHQRRYSLLLEGGHRWIDMRRHGRLNRLPLDVAGHRVHEHFPLPVAETDAREPGTGR
jgi:starch-binding outer membrane protein, SusD/RagB family